jgi:hypothetical protein
VARWLWCSLLGTIVFATAACSGGASGPSTVFPGTNTLSNPGATAAPSPTAGPATVAPTALPTASPAPSAKPTPTVAPASTPTGAPTPVPSASSAAPATTPSPAASPTPTAKPTPAASPTPTASPTPAASPTPVVSPTPVASPTLSAYCYVVPSPKPQLVSPAPGATNVAASSGSLTLTVGLFQPPAQWALEVTSGGGYYAAMGPLRAVGTPSPSGEQLYATTVTGLNAHTTYAFAGSTALFIPPPPGHACSQAIELFTFGTFTTQ